jgi:hypothetical protein
MMSVGEKSSAYAMASASARRPSASVLSTSTVRPFLERSTSPGRMARPSGMFSVAATMPCTTQAGLRAAMACMAAITAAPPAMSTFIDIMPSLSLMDRPPESNVRPLPTSASTGALRGLPSGE